MGKVLLVACTSVGRALLDAIYNNESLSEVELCGLVNLKPKAAINKANYDEFADLVEKYGINTYYCDNINEQSCIEFMKQCEPDIIIQSGWSQKFSEEVLSIPKYACIGEHPAPLPKGRGAACVNWAIITGEQEWGDTFFKMEMQYDTGAIYGQNFFRIEEYDDVKTVYDKVASCAVKTLCDNLKLWVNGIFNSIPQDDSLATHYPRRKPENGLFDFKQDAKNIYNQIRGQAKPYPGAFFMYKSKKVYVWKATLNCFENNDGGYNIVCGNGQKIRLLRVQQEGCTEEWAKDFFIRNESFND